MPLAIELILHVLPGRAQESGSSRFAFADTTLLRDTLDLRFDRLFSLADSLRLTPDTLRALSIRYRTRLERLVLLADSMRVPVDSVGPILDRERFNPLASSGRRITTFHYTSGYTINQTSTNWNNNSDYNFVSGALFVRNNTNIQLDRSDAGGRTSHRQTRTSVTEGGWKFSPDLSVGGRANLDRFNSSDPASSFREAETKNEFQLSMRSRQRPRRGLSSEVNFFSGVLDLSNSLQIKQGLSGDLNGRLRLDRGDWLTHDLSGQTTGNLARTGIPSSTERASSHDYSSNLRGVLGLFASAPVAANLNYAFRRVTVETPQSSTVRETVLTVVSPGVTDTSITERVRLALQKVRNNNKGADLAVRMRQDRDRFLNLTARYGTSEQFTAALLNSQTQRTDFGYGVDGRYLFAGWNLDGGFSDLYSQSKFPTRAVTNGNTGGYGESLRTVAVNGSATRTIGRQLVIKGSGRVTLAAYRHYLINQYPNPPVNRDQYQQNYRLDGNYTQSEKFNSSVALDVTRSLTVNIPSASTAGNTETNTYRAEWRWSYRMLKGLTATQSNAISADYLKYPFNANRNRLTLDYSTLTTLNAVPSPRLTVDITHNTRFQPSGNYGMQPDGLEYLSRSDESQSYTLRARIAYTPSPILSLVITPDYQASGRDAAGDEGLVPQRKSRALNFSGGASVNLPLGGRGRLTGDILRSYRADRSFTYGNDGTVTATPRSQIDYWNGSLQLTWDL